MRVGGKSIFRVMGSSTSYFDPTGLAAARIDALALRVVIIPALAIDTVCCSYEIKTRKSGNVTNAKWFSIYHDFV
jgi:hypothetical protein